MDMHKLFGSFSELKVEQFGGWLLGDSGKRAGGVGGLCHPPA